MNLQPRAVRLKDAPGYLGMDKNRFNVEVRPYLTEIPIGSQGIAFDRLELDAWFEHYKACNGRPAKEKGGYQPWRNDARRVSSSEVGSGTSTKLSEEQEFEKALARATSQKRRSS